MSEPCAFPVAVLAHQLGHVTTRPDDYERREGFDARWAWEMCADYYAYKWGFGREIREHRRRRDPAHRGPAPGWLFFIGAGEGGAVGRFRLNRRFHLCFLQSETAEGEVIEAENREQEARRWQGFLERLRSEARRERLGEREPE
jgi:hypothetical protein